MAEQSVSPDASPTSAAVSPVRRALISVHDKTGIAEFARALAENGVRLVSTGGTAAHLKDAGIPVSPSGRSASRSSPRAARRARCAKRRSP